MTYIVYHIRNGVCKYHVVFAPKYRRKAFYDARRLEIGAIFKTVM